MAFGERNVLLCKAHAGIARNSGVKSLAKLRELFAESNGQRSYVSRRGNAGGGAMARGPGRRATDGAP